MLKKIALAAAATSATFVVLPAAAQAQWGGYNDSRYDSRYEQAYRTDRYGRTYDRYGNRVRTNSGYYGNNGYYGADNGYYGRSTRYNDRYRTCSGTTGTIVGGVAGALLGREITRGNGGYYSRGGSGTTGAIIGGAVGALAGRAIDKSRCR
jgi:hypothetical protein